HSLAGCFQPGSILQHLYTLQALRRPMRRCCGERFPMNRREFLTVGSASVIALWPGRSRAFVVAGPEIRPGERFHFRTLYGKGPVSTLSMPSTRGPAYIPPLPIEQTIVVALEIQGDKGPCFVIEANRTLPSFLPDAKEKTYPETAAACIDKNTGDIRNVKTTMTIAGSVSNSVQRDFGRQATFANFYGAWMLDLKDGYDQTYAAESTTNVKVILREAVSGRNCFVVKEIVT